MKRAPQDNVAVALRPLHAGERLDLVGDAGRILEGRATLPEVGREVFDPGLAVASGAATKSEALRHREFILTYKRFEPLGPSCLPL